MKGLKNRAISLALWIWQLPQNLLGLLLVSILKPEDSYDFNRARLYYAPRMRGGISLGRYVIIAEHYMADFKVWDHELGHARQSRLLGPFYLFVVGLPSLLWAAWWNEGRGVSYYSFYTERWADRLGGVSRDE